MKFKIGKVNRYGIDFYFDFLENNDTWLFSYWKVDKNYSKPEELKFKIDRIRKYEI